jgi:hypothetical protein
MFYIFYPDCKKIGTTVSIIIWLTVEFCENRCRKHQFFLLVYMTLHLCVYRHPSQHHPFTPIAPASFLDWAGAWHQFIMTITVLLVVREGYCYFTVQKHHVTFVVLFFSETTFLGKLWVSTKNSEPLIWYYDTLRNDTSIKFDIICVYNFSGPENLNDNCVKIVHTETMDRGFTVTPDPQISETQGPQSFKKINFI